MSEFKTDNFIFLLYFFSNYKVLRNFDRIAAITKNFHVCLNNVQKSIVIVLLILTFFGMRRSVK